MSSGLITMNDCEGRKGRLQGGKDSIRILRDVSVSVLSAVQAHLDACVDDESWWSPESATVDVRARYVSPSIHLDIPLSSDCLYDASKSAIGKERV